MDALGRSTLNGGALDGGDNGVDSLGGGVRHVVLGEGRAGVNLARGELERRVA